MSVEANLCSSCPLAGLTIDVIDLAIENDNDIAGAESYKIIGTDIDGLRTSLNHTYAETYSIGAIKKLSERPRNIDDDSTTNVFLRSDILLNLMKNDPDWLLGIISNRAAKCPGPAKTEAFTTAPTSSPRQLEICRAASKTVLLTLALVPPALRF